MNLIINHGSAPTQHDRTPLPPKNCYQLTITHEHGDADRQTTTIHLFSDPSTGNPSLITLLEALHLVLDNRDLFFSKKALNNALKSAGFDPNEITDYFDPDCTNDGMTYAIVYKYDLVHFDNAGVKHSVIVQR